MAEPLYLANRVKESCNGSGLDSLVLTGAVSGFRTFADAIPTGVKTAYLIQDGFAWEVGIGTLVSGSELSRDTVLDSSDTTTPVNNVSPGSPVKISLSDSPKTVGVVPEATLALTKNATGGLADPTPFRQTIFVDTVADMKAEDGLTDGEVIVCKGQATVDDGLGGAFWWDEDDATSPDNVDTFRNDNSGTGLHKRLRFGIQELDTDNTLAADSDARVPSQKAIKAYVDGILATNDAMVFQGGIDCSTNPNYPAADRGHTYRVTVAGKIGGGSGPNVEAGDLLICATDSTASGTHAAVGSNWVIAQTNVDGAVSGPASSTDSGIALFDGTSGKVLKTGLTYDTDDDMAANSDTRVATQSATRSYVQNKAKVRGYVSADELGAVADATTDDRAAIQSAQTSLGVFGGVLLLPGNLTAEVGENGSNNYCLQYTAPITIEGQGIYSAVKPDAGIATDVDNFWIKPNNSYNFRYVRYMNILVGNPNDGTRAGNRAFWFDLTAAGFVANALMDGIHVNPGAGYALEITNDDELNVTGQFFCSEFRRSVFNGGVYIDGAGDNLYFQNIVLTGAALGLFYRGTTDQFDNGPAQLVIFNCNSTAEDGAVQVNRSRMAGIIHSNFEQLVAHSGYMVEYEPEVRDAAKTITGFTNANPGVLTVSSHGYSNDDDVYIPTMVGMSGALEGRHFKVVAIDANTFSLATIFGVAVDTSALAAFSSGTIQKVTHRAGPNIGPKIESTAFGAATSAGLAAMLRIGSGRGGYALNNSFLDGGGGATADIVIEANSYGFWVGPNITHRSSGMLITDNGVGTRGVTKAASLQNSWVDFGSGLAVVEFVKDVDGLVHITGTCKAGTTTGGTVLFTLPAGFRPAAIHRFMVLVDDSGGYTVPGFIVIQTNGEVQIGYVPTAGGAGNQAISFNITFRAALGNSIVVLPSQ